MHPNPCRSYLPALLLSGLLLIAACTTTQQDAAEAEEAAKSAERRQHAPSPPVAEAPTAEGLAMSADLDFASQNRYAPPVDREGYAAIVENDFKRPTDTPLSTFSIDVDAASYANVRRFLDGGALPVHDAVRIEELVNYFEYDYPDPEGEHPFAVVTEVSECPWAPDHRLVHIGLQGERIDTRDLPPSNLVFLIDVSGSMNSPDKLPLLKQAFALLADNLREQDRVAIVVYAGAAGVVLEPTNDRQAILDALDRLEAGGSTAGGAGIKLAYALAREALRRREEQPRDPRHRRRLQRRRVVRRRDDAARRARARERRLPLRARLRDRQPAGLQDGDDRRPRQRATTPTSTRSRRRGRCSSTRWAARSSRSPRT